MSSIYVHIHISSIYIHIHISTIYIHIFYLCTYIYMSPISGHKAISTKQLKNLMCIVHSGKTSCNAQTLLQQFHGNEIQYDAYMLSSSTKSKKDENYGVEGDPRSGRPTTTETVANIECFSEMARSDCRLTA